MRQIRVQADQVESCDVTMYLNTLSLEEIRGLKNKTTDLNKDRFIAKEGELQAVRTLIGNTKAIALGINPNTATAAIRDQLKDNAIRNKRNLEIEEQLEKELV